MFVNWKEKEAEIKTLEKLVVKGFYTNTCGESMDLTYIGNGLSERLKPFGIEGKVTYVNLSDET